MQLDEDPPVVERKLQRGGRKVFPVRQVEAPVAPPAQQLALVDRVPVALQHFRLHEGHVVGVDHDVELLRDEVRALLRDVLVALPDLLQVAQLQQVAQRGVRLDPFAAVFDVVGVIQLTDEAEHPVPDRRVELPGDGVREEVVVVRQRPVDHAAHRADVEDQRLLPLRGLPLEDVDQLEVPVLVDLIEDRHVRVEAVQALAVAAPVADRRPLRVVVDAVAQRPEARREVARGHDLSAALVEDDARLFLGVGQQVDVRAPLAVLARAEGRVAGHQGRLAVAGADQDQPFAEAPQPGLFVHPAVEIPLDEALPGQQLHPAVVALGRRQEALDEEDRPRGLRFVEAPRPGRVLGSFEIVQEAAAGHPGFPADGAALICRGGRVGHDPRHRIVDLLLLVMRPGSRRSHPWPGSSAARPSAPAA